MKPRSLRRQGDVGYFQSQPTTIGHGVAGVEAEIHQDLVDLAQVRLHQPALRRHADGQADTRIDRPSQQGCGFLKGSGQVGRLQSQRGSP